jgi:hypothetical protein
MEPRREPLVIRKSLVLLLALSALPASADDETYVRVMTCKGTDASVEIYLPESAVTGRGTSNVSLATNTRGLYALDLTEAEKGKHLDPVRLRFSGDRKVMIVEQYLRALPAVRVPLGGGVVDFDNRFASGMMCGPLNAG